MKNHHECGTEIRRELIDEWLAEHRYPEEITGEGGLLKQLTKALLERALEGKLTPRT